MINIELSRSLKPIAGIYISVSGAKRIIHVGKMRRFMSSAWITRQIDGKQVKLLQAVYVYAGPLCIGLLTHWTWKNIRHDFDGLGEI